MDSDYHLYEDSWLCFAAGTFLQIVGRVPLVTQTGQRAADTGLLAVENLSVDVLSVTAFIDAIVELNSPR